MQPIRVAAVAATIITACLAAVVPAGAASAAGTAPSAETPRAAEDYVLVTLPNANVPNFHRRTVNCPTGYKAVGGGAEARGVNAILVGSFPTDDQRGWVGIGRQPGYNDVGISVYAICTR